MRLLPAILAAYALLPGALWPIAPQPPDSGIFPASWINGTNCPTEPSLQVHAQNDDLYIIRQGASTHFESPFMYLIFGDERAYLLNRGSMGNPPIQQTAQRIIRDDYLVEPTFLP